MCSSKRWLWLGAFLLAVVPVVAQGPANPPPPSNVSGTILDPTGVPYNTGYIRFDLVPSGGPVPCVGTPCTSINGHYGNVYLDGNGAFQMNLYANSLITPANTKWQITVSEPGNPAPWCFGPQSFTTAVTIPNNQTVDLSATLSALAPQLCRNGGAVSGPPCTTTVKGTKDIIPQTCAGEWTLQGVAGNPTVKNFTVLPASDQTAINTYSGDPAASFTNIAAFSLLTDNPLTDAFSAGTVFDRTNNKGLFFAGLMGYNEDKTGGGALNPVFGVRCIAVGSATAVGEGTIQACESEAYNVGSVSTNVMDAYSGVAITGGTASTGIQATFYASKNQNLTGTQSKVSNNTGLFIESQNGVGSNNYDIIAQTVNNTNGPNFIVFADTGHVNIPALGSAVLPHVCYNAAPAESALGTFLLSLCNGDTPAAFATLPTCNGTREGNTAAVTDSTTNVWGATITGAGANHVLAYCDGTNWTVAAK